MKHKHAELLNDVVLIDVPEDELDYLTSGYSIPDNLLMESIFEYLTVRKIANHLDPAGSNISFGSGSPVSDRFYTFPLLKSAAGD